MECDFRIWLCGLWWWSLVLCFLSQIASHDIWCWNISIKWDASNILCSKICYTEFLYREDWLGFFPSFLLSLFLSKFGIARSVSGCRLEEHNKAVSITSKLVKAKYYPEAEEYPAYIHVWSKGKEGGCWGSCNRMLRISCLAVRGCLPLLLGMYGCLSLAGSLSLALLSFAEKPFYICSFFFCMTGDVCGVFYLFGVGLFSIIAKHSYLHVYFLPALPIWCQQSVL